MFIATKISIIYLHHRRYNSPVWLRNMICRYRYLMACVDAPGNGRGTAGAVALVEALKIQNPKELSLRGKFCFSVIVQPLCVMRLSGGNVYFVRDIGVDVCNSTFSVVNKYGDN